MRALTPEHDGVKTEDEESILPEGASLTPALGVESTRAGLAEVLDSTASVGVSLGSKRALAEVAAVLVDALGSGSTGIALAFIQVHTLEEQLELRYY